MLNLKTLLKTTAGAIITAFVMASYANAADMNHADIKAIKDRGVLKVGVKNDVVGFSFQDPLSSEYTGMEDDLARKVAEKLGVKIELTAVTAATRTELLDSGDLDLVLATFTITPERKARWDFTTPYYTDYVSVLVEDSKGFKTLKDLVGQTIGVSSGSTSAKSLIEAMIQKNLIDGKNYKAETFDPATWAEGVKFHQYDDYPSISTALKAGEVGAFCVDKSILNIYKTKGRSYLEDQFAPQEYGAVTKKGSGLFPLVNELIEEWLKDGTIDNLKKEHKLD